MAARWRERTLRALAAADDSRALRMALRAPPEPDRWRLAGRALLAQNRLEEAQTLLRRGEQVLGEQAGELSALREWIARETATPARARALRASARRVVEALPTRPHPATYSTTEDYIVCPVEGADTVVVNFGLWLPIPAVDRLLGSTGHARVHLREFQARFRRDPLDILRNLDRIDAEILEACGRTGAKRAIYIGASGQGLAAIYWGLRTRADRVLAFSPISSINPAVLEELKDIRRDGDILAPVLSQTRGFEPLDALTGLQASPTPVRVLCGKDHVYDRAHAERLATAPCVEVTLIPQAGHETAAATIAAGEFPRLLDMVLNDR